MKPKDRNPFAPPRVGSTAVGKSKSRPIEPRFVALVMLVISVALSLVYTYFDEVQLRTRMGAWPMLIGSCIVSIACALVTKDWAVAPFCCFCSTVAGDLLAGVIRGWSYAQLHICIPLAAGFSIPALLLALFLKSSLTQSPDE